MAKLSKTRAMVSDDVRRIRARFSQALAHGYTTEEATAYANGDGALVPKKQETPLVSESGPTKVRDTKPVGIVGSRPRPIEPDILKVEPPTNTADITAMHVTETEKVSTKISIPKDWQDLPWPKLKALAESISGSDVKSRKHANEVIDKVVS